MAHKQATHPQAQPIKLHFDFGYAQFWASLLMLILFFVLPVVVISDWGNISNNIKAAFDIPAGQTGSVAGLATDNSGRYYNLPILNFRLDTTLREPSTISFLFGVILFVLSIVIILILFADFRKKEKKYS